MRGVEREGGKREEVRVHVGGWKDKGGRWKGRVNVGGEFGWVDVRWMGGENAKWTG